MLAASHSPALGSAPEVVTVPNATKVTRVLRVSSDGTRVVFYKPPLGWHLSREGVAPAPPQGALVHSWDALPQALWAKYACAAKFVSLVRQKTPKIILYAEYALCILLGSGDLEASFYSGARVVCSGNHVQLMDVGGPQRHLTLPVDPQMLPPSQRSLWQITCEDAVRWYLNGKVVKNVRMQ
ncbi:serine/threonine-protein kinase PLK4-like [Ixodes scapularis]|uniref:serine/threonine-protein kinase PLK4-like n=1 Tax=Ixodes scapularis TaxID=6945 RepID=UPI001C3805E8|nr:serine/threonine-protein kinase PLK4-like [Ixodes scapularis]